METRQDDPLVALQGALDGGDMGQVRRELTRLNHEQRERLRLELGDEQYELVYRLIRRARRGTARGRVILLHGIMGSTLSVQRAGKTFPTWVNYWQLFNGRLADLKLNADGGPVDDEVRVSVTGQERKYYLPMLLKLDQRWEAKPFAYDWREDISISAARLAEMVEDFGAGKPVHLVAHSMGGLVSRCLMERFPDLWQAMADADGLQSGGRLVMLGTPNHGSYAIPLALSGEEKAVRMLSLIDRRHNREEILDVLGTFPGSYQMLPSPLLELGDDHLKLFKKTAWGHHPVSAALLNVSERFHREIRQAIDPARHIYVAGYNRKTPYRIAVESPGKFRYQITREGDGRVPHELGLLDNVPTYWVDATHGDLARDRDVLDAIDELLERGKSSVLATVRPTTRAVADNSWYSADSFEDIEPQVRVMLGTETRSTRARRSRLSDEEQLRIEQELVSDYLGEALTSVSRPQDPQHARRSEVSASTEGKSGPRLRVEVVWGDITRCEGQVYAVGHYQGVLPQVAELALDAAMSDDPARENPERHVLRQHTLRGTLRGALGDVDFFPWRWGKGDTRTVAVAGMGYIGNFTPSALRVLTRRLAWAVSGLPGVDTVCTVLIGSGEGALTVEEALSGLVLGMADALGSDLGASGTQVKTVRIVEIYRDRAEHIHRYLTRNVEHFRPYLDLDIPPEPVRGKNAHVSAEDGLWLMLDAMLASSTASASTRRENYDAMLSYAARRSSVKKAELKKALADALERDDRTDELPNFYVSQRPEAGNNRVPFRMSYLTDGDDIRAAAISDTATVSERVLRFNRALVDKLCAEVMDPDAPLREESQQFLRQLVVPQEFRDVVDRGESFVFEVDRAMAQIPWEILAAGDGAEHSEPLAIRAQVARQLRTSFSSGPGVGDSRGGGVRALVIGDPGSPSSGDNLPGAQTEALAVYDLLSGCGIDTQLLIGAEDTARVGRLRDFPVATLAAALEKLMLERFDILHYCGHGDFDPNDTTRAGWVFGADLLTAYELERVSEVPSLVLANACLSGRTSQRARGTRVRRARDEVALLPSLADEFFRRGVMNYIGTAWEVSDEGSVLFAKSFYNTLFSERPEGEGQVAGMRTVGSAVLTARCALWKKRAIYDKLWAAYQHYGDPTSPIRFGN